MINIITYYKELYEALDTFDPYEYRRFVNKYKNYYSDNFNKLFSKASDELVLLTMAKMILNSDNKFSKQTIRKARKFYKAYRLKRSS